MRTLMIKDLSVNLELDRQAMSAVRGGLSGPASALSQDFPYYQSYFVWGDAYIH
jgi:hypothetical protein